MGRHLFVINCGGKFHREMKKSKTNHLLLNCYITVMNVGNSYFDIFVKNAHVNIIIMGIRPSGGQGLSFNGVRWDMAWDIMVPC